MLSVIFAECHNLPPFMLLVIYADWHNWKPYMLSVILLKAVVLQKLLLYHSSYRRKKFNSAGPTEVQSILLIRWLRRIGATSFDRMANMPDVSCL
jgi:hypothetical protein